jgi:hypothetical protein
VGDDIVGGREYSEKEVIREINKISFDGETVKRLRTRKWLVFWKTATIAHSLHLQWRDATKNAQRHRQLSPV